MKQALVFTTRAVFSGLLIIVPIYLAILLLLKGMKWSAGQEFEAPAPPHLQNSASDC
jgi:hypothetical protein